MKDFWYAAAHEAQDSHIRLFEMGGGHNGADPGSNQVNNHCDSSSLEGDKIQ